MANRNTTNTTANATATYRAAAFHAPFTSSMAISSREAFGAFA